MATRNGKSGALALALLLASVFLLFQLWPNGVKVIAGALDVRHWSWLDGAWWSMQDFFDSDGWSRPLIFGVNLVLVMALIAIRRRQRCRDKRQIPDAAANS